jgi:NADH-quinone oxidoreductase subunit G
MIIQAADKAGIPIPRFCYHDKLAIAANCRMCLVDVEKMGKPAPACATPVMDGMKVATRSEKALKSQRNVMEFLLINHPLDCPICDQGGECELQDLSLGYGRSVSRFSERKRVVADEDMGPLVATDMTRCIHCTRCIRFSAEVAGVPELGAIGRGEDMEITTYLEHAMTSELQSNVVDLCPVGALTSKPYAFSARPWELSKTETIDVMDALGSAIRVDSRGREVMRILPRANDDVNEEWISDKTRHVVDGLRTQRLDRPYVRENGRLVPASWPQAFAAIAARVKAAKPERIGAIAGDLAAVEEMYALKDLMTRLGVKNLDAGQDGAALNPEWGRATYLFNAGIAGIERADALLVIGSNPRREAPVLNARIRQRWRAGKFPVALIGEKVDLTYPYDHLGAGPQTLADLVAGRHSFAEVLKGAERPMIVVGVGALARPDGAAVVALAAKAAIELGAVKEDWNGFCVLHTAAARVGALEIGFAPGEGALDAAAMAKPDALDVLFLLGADEITVPAGAFVVYIGTHGDNGAHRADVILPGAAYPEKSGLYVNTEGRVQMANRATFPPGEAREDWAILRALSEPLGAKLPYDSLGGLRRALFAERPQLARIGQVMPSGAADIRALAKLEGAVDKSPFRSVIDDFYLTNPIARASAVMAECSALAERRAAMTAAE